MPPELARTSLVVDGASNIVDGLRGRQTGRARSRANRDLGQDYAPALHSLRFSKRSNYLPWAVSWGARETG